MPASSAIHQSLSVLLPSHAAKLPSQLVHLSESLLAQSRQRASHLKTDEEIARAYACCEIACKRLRAQCRLPAVKAGGAPCKPAVYKKLVTFLERVLDTDVTASIATPKAKTPTTGKRKATEAELDLELEDEPNETPSKRPRNNHTPSTTPRNAAFLKATSRKKNTTASQENQDGTQQEAPAFVVPSIRKLCRTFATPLLAAHVYTGTCIVLKLTGLWPRDEEAEDDDRDEDENGTGTGIASGIGTGQPPSSQGSSSDETVMGLLIALYLMTLTRMQTAKMTAPIYKATCAKSVQVLSYQPGTDGVEAWIRRINREGYCRGQDWWDSVPESVFNFDPPDSSATGARQSGGKRAVGGSKANVESEHAELAHEGDEDEDEDGIISTTRKSRRRETVSRGAREAERTDEDEDDDDPEGVLLPGLATMMQHAVDFTSEDRTQDFDAWKRTFLRKLDRLDNAAAAAAGKPKPARVSAGRRLAVK
ncbi:hypothetical protein A1O3_00922 [Capronia epimyces CBS 606.96]|uniref:ORC6 first cyclin-like domain-containing protein n=1 Tax=Capronia epimyces CBS 606.96 TaxID=1182542 RepID=W9YHN2_9EURO|nr:uncharacterized protein A1O3_00922 [Capronia epimyces CBS 606.96]EXJ92372.1 hypothetical protein A1O3_00922 [Capronia epimyces CBS 606.96]